MTEIWKPVVGFEGSYEVSNFGRVRSLARVIRLSNGRLKPIKETVLLPHLCKGYYAVRLWSKGKSHFKTIHRLVAQAFIPNPEGKPQIDHIDTNTLNNNVDNLRWATGQENNMNPLSRINRSRAQMGHPNYFKGHHSEETRRKLSELNKGVPKSEEHKRKLSEARKRTIERKKKEQDLLKN